jgi:hypothetical protein
MSLTLVTGTALIALPIAFNVLFTALARTFEYPDVLVHATAFDRSRYRPRYRGMSMKTSARSALAGADVPKTGIRTW